MACSSWQGTWDPSSEEIRWTCPSTTRYTQWPWMCRDAFSFLPCIEHKVEQLRFFSAFDKTPEINGTSRILDSDKQFLISPLYKCSCDLTKCSKYMSVEKQTSTLWGSCWRSLRGVSPKVSGTSTSQLSQALPYSRKIMDLSPHGKWTSWESVVICLTSFDLSVLSWNHQEFQEYQVLQ